MNVPGNNKRIIRQTNLILLLIVSLFYLFLVRPLSQQGISILQNQIDEVVSQLEKYIPRKGDVLPTEETVKTIKTYLVQNNKNFQELKNFINPPKEYLPEESLDPGLYFIEQVHTSRKRLKRQATTLKINIPESFGFSEEMPQDKKNIELLLRELEMIDQSVSLLIEQGVEEISLIKPLAPIEKRDSQTQELSYYQLPVQLNFFCNPAILTKILYQIKNLSPVLVVKDIVVKQTKEQLLQIEMLLTGLEIL